MAPLFKIRYVGPGGITQHAGQIDRVLKDFVKQIDEHQDEDTWHMLTLVDGEFKFAVYTKDHTGTLLGVFQRGDSGPIAQAVFTACQMNMATAEATV